MHVVQIFIVTDKEDEAAVLEQHDEAPNGITPPNTNVVKRKYEKTKRHTPFPVRLSVIRLIRPLDLCASSHDSACTSA